MQQGIRLQIEKKNTRVVAFNEKRVIDAQQGSRVGCNRHVEYVEIVRSKLSFTNHGYVLTKIRGAFLDIGDPA